MTRHINDTNNTSNTLDSRTNIKLPIWYIAGGMVSFSLFLYAQLEIHKRDDDKRFSDVHTFIEQKAADRYTSTEARQHEESVKQRLFDIEKRNETTHSSFQRQIDRNAKDIALISR